MKKSPLGERDGNMRKSWTNRERLLSVLAALAAIGAGRFLGPLLGPVLEPLPGHLFPSSALFSMFLMFLLPILVMGVPFFRWARQGRRLWPWAAGLALCLIGVVLLSRNLPVAARIIAVFTDFYDYESTGFYLLFALLIGGGMMAGVLLGGFLARLFPHKSA